jgi:hypothetical protein
LNDYPAYSKILDDSDIPEKDIEYQNCFIHHICVDPRITKLTGIMYHSEALESSEINDLDLLL